jgi:hypothetical protein
LFVAPHAGAWIETSPTASTILQKSSSLLMRERGLKPLTYNTFDQLDIVAPHAGAWIETMFYKEKIIVHIVAPHAGAWIETLYRPAVATTTGTSLLMRERGLKRPPEKPKGRKDRRSSCGSVD